MPSIREMILSEDYADIIVPYFPCFLNQYRDQGAQVFNDYYGMIHYPLSPQSYAAYFEEGFCYTTIPKLYTLLDTVNLDASGITQVQEQPVLGLTGENIILGFIDTGIDYTHPAFRRSDGSSRICGIWDQTVQTGTPPYDLEYGSAYTQEEIDQALEQEDPFSLIPSRDEIGHGTALAGIAAGTSLPENDFKGAAPQAMIAMVKLKPPRSTLRLFFTLPGMPQPTR